VFAAAGTPAGAGSARPTVTRPAAKAGAAAGGQGALGQRQRHQAAQAHAQPKEPHQHHQPPHKQQPEPRQRRLGQQAGGGSAGGRRVPLGAIAAMTTVMALASGLGAVPFFVFGCLSRPWAALANAVASGVMLAASFGLLHEGAPHGGTALVCGMLLGAAFVKLSQQYLEQ
jgi:hypothetical protein